MPRKFYIIAMFFLYVIYDVIINIKLYLIMKKENENVFQKLFGAAFGGRTVPLRTNVYHNGSAGYSQIGTTASRIFENMDRKSPLLGNYNVASNRLSSYYEKLSELKGYKLLDISTLATSFFSDYIINFLSDDNNGAQLVTILNDDGTINQSVTDRINLILTKDIRIFDYIHNHSKDYVYYSGYYSMLRKNYDEQGHIRFRVEELYDPIAVVNKRKRDPKTGEIVEVFLARSEDNTVYEIPKEEVIYLSTNKLVLENDLTPDWKEKEKKSKQKVKEGDNNVNTREKVLKKESYSASEPLFYGLILKVKELVIKELLVSLISLRDLSSVQIFLLQFDKSIPLESANELCARATKLANGHNEIASFFTAQFDMVSFIESALTQNTKFIPDYNSTLGGKNTMVPLDKLTDKLIDILQSIDQCRNNVLAPLGLPSTLLDSTSGSKWQVLQQSERANSRVSSYMAGIKDSVTSLVCSIYKSLYDSEIDPSMVKLHICEKTSVEYNNQINQSESINGLVQGITSILQNALQTLDVASPLVDPISFLTYIKNLLKDIDPNTENLITEETLGQYVQVLQAKLGTQLEQMGVDPSILQQPQPGQPQPGGVQQKGGGMM